MTTKKTTAKEKADAIHATLNSMIESTEKFIAHIDDDILWMSTKRHLIDAFWSAYWLKGTNQKKPVSMIDGLKDKALTDATSKFRDAIRSVFEFTGECNDVDLLEFEEMRKCLIDLKNCLKK